MNELKKDLRNTIRQKRKSLTPQERIEKNNVIFKTLQTLPAFQSAKTILCYISTPEEVDTHAIIKTLLNKKIIAIPCMQTDTNKLKLVRLKHWESLRPNASGILETNPHEEDLIGEDTIDLTLVPGIAFDRAGHRIGYGKGYYDRLLKRTNGTHIGLAYDCQMVEKIPHEPHDVPVDHIITETSIF